MVEKPHNGSEIGCGENYELPQSGCHKPEIKQRKKYHDIFGENYFVLEVFDSLNWIASCRQTLTGLQ